jgi:hypothetical protein
MQMNSYGLEVGQSNHMHLMCAFTVARLVLPNL